jgi:hypothetical protein
MCGNLSRHVHAPPMTLRSATNCWKRWQGASGRESTPTRIILAAGFCITLKIFHGIFFCCNCSNDEQDSGAGKGSKNRALARLTVHRQRGWPWELPSLPALTPNRMWKQQFTAALSCVETLQMASKSRLPRSAPTLKLKLKPPKTLPSVANKSIQNVKKLVYVFSGPIFEPTRW